MNNSELINITHFVNPYTFWINRIRDDQEFNRFNQKIQKYALKSSRWSIGKGNIVAVQEPQETEWKRAEFDREFDEDIANNINLRKTNTKYTVWLIDEGRPAKISSSPKQLSLKLQEKEAKVEKAAIFGIVPASKEFSFIKDIYEVQRISEWSPACITFLNNFITQEGVELYFNTKSNFTDVVTGDLLIKLPNESKFINFAEFLLNAGLAIEDRDDFYNEIKEHCNDVTKRIISPLVFSTFSSTTNSSPMHSTHRRENIRKTKVYDSYSKHLESKLPPVEMIESKSVGSGSSRIRRNLSMSSESTCSEKSFTISNNLKVERQLLLTDNNDASKESSFNQLNNIKKENGDEGFVCIGRGKKLISSVKTKLGQEKNFNKAVISKSTDEINKSKASNFTDVTDEETLKKGIDSLNLNEESNLDGCIKEISRSNHPEFKWRSTEILKLKHNESPSKGLAELSFDADINKSVLTRSSLTNKVRPIIINKKMKIESEEALEKKETALKEEVLSSYVESDEDFIKRMEKKNKKEQSISTEKYETHSDNNNDSISKVGSQQKTKSGRMSLSILKEKCKSSSMSSSNSNTSKDVLDDSRESSSVNNDSTVEDNIEKKKVLKKESKKDAVDWPTFSSSQNTTLKYLPAGCSTVNKAKQTTTEDTNRRENRPANRNYSNRTTSENCNREYKKYDREQAHENQHKHTKYNSSFEQNVNDDSSSDEDILKQNIKQRRRERGFTREAPKQMRPFKEQKDAVFSRILVHASMKVNKYQSVSDTSFCPSIVRNLNFLRVNKLNSVQSYFWFGAVRGNNIVAVESRSRDESQYYQHCLTYLPPLCDMLLQANFEELNYGRGPFAVVLCPNKSVARSAFDMATEILRGSEKNIPISLLLDNATQIKYCELLITTPCCFVRCTRRDDIHARLVSLHRICHLVIDTADVITNRYANELEDILGMCRSALINRRKNVTRNIQILASSEYWTPKLERLCKQTPDPPIVIIKPPIEAALYSKINIQLHFLESQKKMNQILDIINNKYQYYKTLIICTNDEELKHVKMVLETNGISIIYITTNCLKADIIETVSRWNCSISGNYSVCIGTDDLLSDIEIISVQWLIHYSLPHSWSYFSHRFFTLVDNYQSPLLTTDLTKPKCNVHIFIDEENQNQIPRMVWFLKRTNVNITKELEEINKSVMQKRELKLVEQKVPLCGYLKSFGECPHEFRCKLRHRIFYSCDKPAIDVSIGAHVNLCLLEIYDASHFAARLFKSSEDQYIKIAMKMSECYRTAPLPVTWFDDDNLYAVQDPIGVFNRCKLIEIYEKHVKAKLIDTGRIKVYNKLKFAALPKELQFLPPQAIDVYISGVKPTDNEEIWDSQGKKHILNLLNVAGVNKPSTRLSGVVELVLGCTIWLRNANLYERYESTKCCIDKFNWQKVLLKENYAAINWEHMSKLKKNREMGGFTVINDVSETNPEIKVEVKKRGIQKAHLEVGGNFKQVDFLAAEKGNMFYLGLVEFNDILNKLLNEITAEARDPVYPRCSELTEGLYCIMYNSNESVYYRVKIETLNQDGTVNCWLLDEGFSTVAKPENILPIKTESLEKLPAQAIACRLYAANCNAETDLIEYEGSKLWAKCVEKNSEGIHAVILLDREEGDHKINLELLKSGKAEPIEEEEVIESDFDLEENFNGDSHIDSEEENEIRIGELDDYLNAQNLDQFDFVTNDFDQFMQEMDLHTQSTDSDEKDENRLALPGPVNDENMSMVSEESEADIVLPNSFIQSDTRTPNVMWYQTPETVILRVQLSSVNIYELIVRQEHVHFSTTCQGYKYDLNLTLYKNINEEKYNHVIKGREVQIVLHKLEQNVTWPRLLKSKQRCQYIKVDLEHELSDSESEDDRVKPILQKIGELGDDGSSNSEDIEYDFASDGSVSSDYSLNCNDD